MYLYYVLPVPVHVHVVQVENLYVHIHIHTCKTFFLECLYIHKDVYLYVYVIISHVI